MKKFIQILNIARLKTRKYWIPINLLLGLGFIVISLVFEAMGISRGWAGLLLYLPFTAIVLTGGDMVLTKGEIWKIISFFMILIFAFFILSAYSSNHNINDVLSLETKKILFGITIFFAGLGFFVGYLPFKIIGWKRKVFDQLEYESMDAAVFIFRKLPDEIAQKTNLNMIAEILDEFFNLTRVTKCGAMEHQEGDEIQAKKQILEKHPEISANDLDIILGLEGEYIKNAGIVRK